MPAERMSPTAAYLAVGALAGLSWAAALRGWMAQLVSQESTFTWLTFALVLASGVAVGVLCGRAAHLRSAGGRPDRRLVFTPVLFLAALLDPVLFKALITTGEGGGAIWVVLTALAGGFALSRSRWSVGCVLAAAFAVLGLLGMIGLGSMSGPLSSARGAWVGIYGLILVLLLCLASALPYPTVRPALQSSAFVAVGVAVGLAWACALRAFMAEVAGTESTVDWTNTFGFVLLPAGVAGGLLGWAEYARRRGGAPGWRWLALSPFLLAAVLLRGLIEDPAHLFSGGIGLGALAVPLLGVIGGHALSQRGPVPTRIAAALLGLTALVTWPLVGPDVGGASLAMTSPHGIWAAVLYDGLLVVLMLAASIPQRALLISVPSHPCVTSTSADTGHARRDLGQPQLG